MPVAATENVAAVPTGTVRFVGCWVICGAVNLERPFALLNSDGLRIYSSQDEIPLEGRAMSNAILGVTVFVPRPAMPSGATGIGGRSLPIV